MSWLTRFNRYLRDALRGRRLAREIDEELRFHIDALVDELTARGASPDEARRIAARRFGRLDLMKDEAHYAKGVGLVDDLRQDVRYGLRRLRREPTFAATVILTIGLAIGLNAAIFAVLNGVLLRPLPYRAPDRLVAIWKTLPDQGPFTASQPDFLDWRDRNTVFESVAATREGSFRNELDMMAGAGAARLTSAEVSPNLFPLLGVNAAQGRTFLPEDDLPGRNRVVVLGHDTWKHVFGADTRIIGTRIRLDREQYEVVGVLPAGVDLTYPRATALFVPLERARDNGNYRATERRGMGVHVYARLKAGVTVERAQAEMRTLTATLAREYPAMSKDERTLVVPLHEDRFGQTRAASQMLAVAVGLVLLIAAVNIANLLLARGVTRAHEMAVRSALGSGRMRLVRQLLAENLLLALLGGAGGMLFATAGTRIVVALAPATLPRLDEVGIDGTVVAFTLGCAIVCALLFGLFPAFRASKPDIGASLKTGRSRAAGAPRRVRGAFVVAEVALVLVLLATAGLMANSLWRLFHVELGFDPHNVLAAEFFVPNRVWDDGRPWTLSDRSRGDSAIRTLSERLLAEVRRLPGVTGAGTTTCLPLNGGYALRGFGSPGSRGTHFVDERRIDPGYLPVMGARLISGRLISESDRNGPPVVLVSRELERAFFPAQSAVGRHLSTGGVSFEIVGVIGDMRERSMTAAASPVLYFDAQQNVAQMVRLYLTVRTAQQPAAMADAVRRAVRRVDPELPIRELTTLDDLVTRNLVDTRFYATVLTTFSLVALALAAIGIYGLLSQAVGQRVREIGVRIALGASRARVRGLVFAEASVLVGAGLFVGLAATWAATRAIRTFLFNVTPTDPVTLVVVTILLVLVAACAASVPARRATRIDPITALRCE